MSKKRTTYSSAFKTKLVLELLQNESTLAEIASKHNVLPQNLVNWKKTFLANAEITMEPSKAVKEYKQLRITLPKYLNKYRSTVRRKLIILPSKIHRQQRVMLNILLGDK
jgi:putative transposase